MKTLFALVLVSLGACSDSSSPNAPVVKINKPGDATAEGKTLPPPSVQPSSIPTPSPSTTLPPAPTQSPIPAPFNLSSSAFANNQKIPVAYVAKNNGGNQSPPLQWTTAPTGTGSFAIQMVDLDFRTPPFIHWIITNIPASSSQIPAGIPAGNNLAQPLEARGAMQAKSYAGPNPPNLHRYEWTIYAIKAGETLNLSTTDSAANKRELETKSLARSVLLGTFE